jgi:hypothetical protein
LTLFVTGGADLGDDHEAGGIRMERLVDELVGDVRAIELGGVDVIDAGLHCPTQHGDRSISILRRPEDACTGELHRPKTEAMDAVTRKQDWLVRHNRLA